MEIPVFGQRVKRRREGLQLSVQELATRADTTYQTIWRIERGDLKEPSIVIAQRIASAMHVGVDYLLDMFHEPNDTGTKPKKATKGKRGRGRPAGRRKTAVVG